MTLQEMAKTAVEHASDEMFHEHRGVMKWFGHVAVFGNDGYRQDERTRTLVEVFRQYLDDSGIKELAFAVDDRCDFDGIFIPEKARGYSWAMLVEGGDLDALHRFNWESHRIAQGKNNDDPGYASFRQAQGG